MQIRASNATDETLSFMQLLAMTMRGYRGGGGGGPTFKVVEGLLPTVSLMRG